MLRTFGSDSHLHRLARAAVLLEHDGSRQLTKVVAILTYPDVIVISGLPDYQRPAAEGSMQDPVIQSAFPSGLPLCVGAHPGLPERPPPRMSQHALPMRAPAEDQFQRTETGAELPACSTPGFRQ